MKTIAISKRSAHKILRALGYRVNDMRRVAIYNGVYDTHRLAIMSGVSLLRTSQRSKYVPLKSPQYYIFIDDPKKEGRCKDESQTLELCGISG